MLGSFIFIRHSLTYDRRFLIEIESGFASLTEKSKKKPSSNISLSWKPIFALIFMIVGKMMGHKFLLSLLIKSTGCWIRMVSNFSGLWFALTWCLAKFDVIFARFLPCRRSTTCLFGLFRISHMCCPLTYTFTLHPSDTAISSIILIYSVRSSGLIEKLITLWAILL